MERKILISLLLMFCFVSYGNAWPIAYQKTGKSVPSIEVKLLPPEDPLPQVSASIQLLEKERMKVEEALMAKLEDVFNKMLDESHKKIKTSVEKAMRVFEDRKMLDRVVSDSLLPLESPMAEGKKMRSSFPAFRQNIMSRQPNTRFPISLTVDRTAISGGAGVTPLRRNVSPDSRFLQLKMKSKDPDLETNEQQQSRIGSDTGDSDISNTKDPAASAVPTTAADDSLSISSSIQSLDDLDKTRSAVQRSTTETNSETHTEHAGGTAQNRTVPTSNNGPLAVPISFLQVLSRETIPGGGATRDAVDNVINKLANSAAPTVNIEIVDLFEPSDTIEDKIKEIEEKRNDEEGKMFQMAADELEQLTKIMIQELEKNIQLQMNPFLVDSASVGTMVLGKVKKYAMPGGTLIGPTKFRQINPHDVSSNTPEKIRFTELPPSRKPSLAVEGFSGFDIQSRGRIPSFMQVKAKVQSSAQASGKLRQRLSSGESFLNPDQLNVRVAASDKPYPTIDELTDVMEKKRDATERLERAKILELQLRLMRAQNEMIKDALHEGVARVLALIGKTAETIKTEMVGWLIAEGAGQEKSAPLPLPKV